MYAFTSWIPFALCTWAAEMPPSSTTIEGIHPTCFFVIVSSFRCSKNMRDILGTFAFFTRLGFSQDGVEALFFSLLASTLIVSASCRSSGSEFSDDEDSEDELINRGQQDIRRRVQDLA